MRAQVNYNNTFSERHDYQVLVGAERRKVVTSQNGFYRLGYDDQTLVYSEINALDLNKCFGALKVYTEHSHSTTRLRVSRMWTTVMYHFMEMHPIL